ncbi:unnamed protein product [Arctia plantaginis]|uniref:Uncharacterized protein n=1 Tax=Arctia plantaginis TaxID=874455 RepID=A0A8S0YRP0_ARCPL|nr:unnamed protein product [Arctia plantaginis]
MGVSGCMSVRQARGSCHCPACPRSSGHGAPMPPQTLVLPPMALEPETTPVKDKKGSKMKVLKKIKKKIGLVLKYDTNIQLADFALAVLTAHWSNQIARASLPVTYFRPFLDTDR